MPRARTCHGDAVRDPAARRRVAARDRRPFDAAEHVLRDRATALGGAHAALAPQITEDLLAEVTALVPPGWFGDRGADAYVEHLVQRAPIVPEVIRP